MTNPDIQYLLDKGYTFTTTATSTFIEPMTSYEQYCLDKGYTLSEIRKPGKPLTLDEAQRNGFDTVEEYREALHEFLNGQ